MMSTKNSAKVLAKPAFGKFWLTMAPAAVLALGASVLAAKAEEITISHSVANFGEAKYPADMAHLDYVNPNAPKGGEYSQAAQGTFDSFNPYTRKGVTGALTAVMYERILTSTADDIYGSYCYLCTTMEYPDSRDWVIFNLRDDVTFSDGSPMTAEDVEFTFNLFIEQGITEYRNVVEGFVSSVEVLDTHKIKFNFTDEAPRRDVLTFAGGTQVFSKKWFEETGTRLDESTLVPFMGTGAYVLDSFDAGRQIVYARNPNFWGDDHPMNIGGNNFDTIRVEYFADGSAALEGFKSGEYTFRSENSSKQWATAYDFPGIQDGSVVKAEIHNGNIGNAQSYIFNLRLDKFQDPKVREAVGLMFNFEWSNETLFFGLYERVNSFWENSPLEARGVPSADEVALLQPLVDEGLLPADILTAEPVMAPVSGERAVDRGNLRKASALLDEAGWVTDDAGVRRKNGEALSVEILSYSPTFDRIHNPYIENLKRLGIEASMERVDTSQYVERLNTANFDMVTHSFRMGFEPGIGLKQWYASETAEDSSRNLMSLRNPAVDRLVDNVIDAQSQEDLATAVHALDRALRAEGFWVPQWFKDVHTVAYYDMYKHPENLPPYALGQLSFWWWDADRAEELKAAGAY